MIGTIAGAALGEALGGLTSAMTGQNLTDAFNQRMTDTYKDSSGLEIGVGNYTDNKPSISGNTSNTVVDSTDSDPSVAFENHETAGGAVSPTTGGFVDGSNVGTYNYSLLEDSNGNVKAVAPVSVPVKTALVALAQALGLSMKISRVDPILVNKFVRNLVAAGCVYDKARDLVTGWWDGLKMLFPKRAIDAVQQTIEENDIPLYDQTGDIGTATSSLGTVSISTSAAAWNPNSQTPEQDSYIFEDDGASLYLRNGTLEFVSLSSFTAQRRRADGTILSQTVKSGTINDFSGVPHTFYRSTWAIPTAYVGYAGPLETDMTTDNARKTLLFGQSSYPSPEYPEGMSRSVAGHAYTPSTIPVEGGVAHKVIGGTGVDTIDVVSVRVDEDTLNGDTTESTSDPITANPDPDVEQELPPAPIPTPIPDTNVSNPDVPLVDSSVVNSTLINELVEELANTLDPQPEQSSGTIPFPWLPGAPVIDPGTGEQTGTQYPSIVPASGPGLIHVYNPTPGEFVGFGNWLWVTYADATIDKIWNNPFDGIIGAHELYATPQVDGNDNIRSGFLVCPVTSDLVRQRYTEIDCGTVIIPEFYGNYFDYSPYSQAYIYLPFIGINEVSIDDIVGHAVNIIYRVDAYNGSCIAMIYVAKSGYRNLCYQFGGNCAVEVPLAGGSQAAIKAGVLQAEAYSRAAIQSAQIQKTASIGSGIVSGAANGWAGPLAGLLGALAGGTAGYIQGSANLAAAKLQGQAMQEAARYANKSSVQHSGQFGASHGAMGLKNPFIMIRNPIQVKVVNYNDDYGFPAHKRVIIGGCTGYIRVREVNVISAHATNEEKRAIEEELKAGVYVS